MPEANFGLLLIAPNPSTGHSHVNCCEIGGGKKMAGFGTRFSRSQIARRIILALP
jgi:hypothetical protein